MKRISIALMVILSLSAIPLLTAGEDKPKAEKEKLETYATDYYKLSHSDKWQAKTGQGYVEIRGKKGDAKQVWIRAYAIGLRSLGGKFRNLEHVVDDMIFQVRDEFKGKVSKKSSVKVGKGEKINARHMSGEQPFKKSKIKVLFYAADHPTEKGVVISFSYSGSPKAFEKHKEEAMRILSTWEVVKPKQ